MKNVWGYLIMMFMGIILGAVILHECNHKKDSFPAGNIISSDTLRVHDTITYHDTIGKPVPQFRDTGSTKYIPANIDSAHIFDEYVKLHHLYYTRNIYDRTLKDDSTALVRLKDTVFENELQGSALTYQNRTPTYYITKTLMAPNTGRLLIGGEYAFKSPGFVIGIHYLTKGYMEYTYGYNLQRGEHSVGFFMNIFPRNRSPGVK